MIEIKPIPCLKDNYAYLVFDPDSPFKECAVVDPSESNPVLREIEKQGRSLSMIWLTHHHWDHVGGIVELVSEFPAAKVIGSYYDFSNKRIPKQTTAVGHEETFRFENRSVTTFEVPGHTLGALAYKIEEHLFTGDTLFLGGCGRVFEGTMERMSQSMLYLRAQPSNTKIWCGHEYTLKNLAFAKNIEPKNVQIEKTIQQVEQKIQATGFSVPGDIKTEKETNPFFRFDLPSLKQNLTEVESFSRIRKLKDQF